MFLLKKNSYVYRLGKEFIEKYYQDEAIFFDNIWEIYEPELNRLMDLPPEKWHFKIRKYKLLGALGFADPSQMPDLVTTKIIEIISKIERSISWRLMYEKIIPERKEIEKMIEINIGSFELPSGVETNLRCFLLPVCLEDVSKISVALSKEESRIKIIERGEQIEYSREKVRELKQRKGEFDIWIIRVYESGEKDEILINKNKVIIRDQALRFLICLLKAAGRLCGYPEVFREAWGEPKRLSKAFERGKIVQSWRELRENEFLKNNIEVIPGKGFFVKEGLRNHCIIYSTQLNARK